MTRYAHLLGATALFPSWRLPSRFAPRNDRQRGNRPNGLVIASEARQSMPWLNHYGSPQHAGFCALKTCTSPYATGASSYKKHGSILVGVRPAPELEPEPVGRVSAA